MGRTQIVGHLYIKKYTHGIFTHDLLLNLCSDDQKTVFSLRLLDIIIFPTWFPKWYWRRRKLLYYNTIKEVWKSNKVHTSGYKFAVQAPHSGIVCAKGWEAALRLYHHVRSLELAHREVAEEQKTRIAFHR